MLESPDPLQESAIPDQLVSTHTQHWLLMDLQYTLSQIKWKEQQERCFDFNKAPKITSVSSPLLVQTRTDIIPVQ